MKLLSYNEQIEVCAQNENPFVQNKPYSPNEVLRHVIMHLMDGSYPSPGDEQEAQRAKSLFIAALQTLHEANMSITEQSIVKMRSEILSKVDQAQVSQTQEVAQKEESPVAQQEEIKTCDAIKLEFGSKGIILKKEWIKWGVIAILVLLLIKILK